MTTDAPIRVLFCLGINQNFFDLPADGVSGADVWQATITFLDQLKATPGLTYIADLDDDSFVVGPAQGWPWTCYVLADADSAEAVKAGCNLLRTIIVGESEYKLWKYAKIEARMGRALTVRDA